MPGFDPVCHMPHGNPEPWASYLKKKDIYNVNLKNLNRISQNSLFGENIYSLSNSTLHTMTSILTNTKLKNLEIIDSKIRITNKENKN